MKLTLTALTVAASLMASAASAFDPEDLQKLLDTNECVECDLSGADLSGADLIGANLIEAILRRANLWMADLGAANLTEAVLRGTYMNGTILCNTTMPDGSVIYSGC